MFSELGQAARQAAKEERRRKLEERRAELQRKADEDTENYSVIQWGQAGSEFQMFQDPPDVGHTSCCRLSCLHTCQKFYTSALEPWLGGTSAAPLREERQKANEEQRLEAERKAEEERQEERRGLRGCGQHDVRLHQLGP